MFVVPKRNVQRRVNNAIRKQCQKVGIWRSTRHNCTKGNYYLHDYRNNSIPDFNLDLEAFARQLGVLNPYETVCGDTG